jgi:type I restriction enzyme S subunit
MSKPWPVIALGNVLKLQRRWVKVDLLTDYMEIGIRSYGRGIFHKSPVSGASLGNKRVLRIEPGDLVFMNVFAWEGAVAVAGANEAGMIGSHRFATYTPVDNSVDPHFLQFYFRTPAGRELLGRVSPGSAGRNRTMNLAAFAEQAIPLPPIEEQRRIVARIDQLADKIAEARVNASLARAEGATLVGARAAEIFNDLGQKLRARTFGSFDAEVTSGPRNWSQYISDNGLRFFRAQDITADFTIDADSKCFIDPPRTGQGAAARLRLDDLLIVITGATVGRCAMYTDGLEPGFVSQHVATCRFAIGGLLPAFALWALRSPTGQEQLLGQRYGQGKPGLNLGNIRAISLPIPPLAEQRRIVEYLDAISAKTETLKQHQQSTAAELDALLPSILDRAFKGEL